MADHPASGTTAHRGFAMVAGYAVVVVVLALLGVASVEMLAGVRAYVGGESLYSKGQKSATLHLLRYLRTGSDDDYLLFERALAVPVGDRIARVELEKPEPDFAVVRRGFLQGGNHADDLDSMIRLYRLFRRVPFMAEAIAIWTEGDREVQAIEAVARTLRAERRAGPLTAAREEVLRNQLLDINTRLDTLEQDFSATLGRAARITQRLLIAATVLLSALLAVLAVLFARRSWQRLDQSRRALAVGNERWELAAAAGDLGVLAWDFASDEVELDARARAHFGLAGGGARRVGRTQLREHVHADDRAALTAAIELALAERRNVDVRFRVVRLDDGGDVRTLALAARSELTQRSLVGFVRDVTSEVQAERLEVERNAAARANAAKSEFLSRVSHELRTPLNAVMGFTQLLLSDRAEPPSAGQQARLERVAEGGSQLLKLVEDLLAVSQVEHERSRERVELRPLVEHAVALLEPQRHRRAVRVRIDAGDAREPLVVDADRGRLSQVMVHVLSNAIHYNSVGGQVQVQLRADGEQALVIVSDTGRGLEPHQVRELFQPFNRLGAERSGVAGSGLGLVVSRRLVEGMGGSLDFASDPPHGSRVTLRLPLRPQAQPAAVASGRQELA
jgi:signal transduction histidine kinase